MFWYVLTFAIFWMIFFLELGLKELVNVHEQLSIPNMVSRRRVRNVSATQYAGRTCQLLRILEIVSIVTKTTHEAVKTKDSGACDIWDISLVDFKPLNSVKRSSKIYCNYQALRFSLISLLTVILHFTSIGTYLTKVMPSANKINIPGPHSMKIVRIQKYLSPEREREAN